MKYWPSLFLLAHAACSALPGDRGGAYFEDRLLDTIPEGVNINVPVAYSRDGRRAAYAARTPEGDYAVCGGWKGKTYTVV